MSQTELKHARHAVRFIQSIVFKVYLILITIIVIFSNDFKQNFLSKSNDKTTDEMLNVIYVRPFYFLQVELQASQWNSFCEIGNLKLISILLCDYKFLKW